MFESKNVPSCFRSIEKHRFNVLQERLHVHQLLLLIQRKFDEAAPAYKRALEIQEKALGPNHPDLATTLNNLGFIFQDQVGVSYALLVDFF